MSEHHDKKTALLPTLHSWHPTSDRTRHIMIGLLGIGLRVTAVAGAMPLMARWVASWPIASLNAAGEPTSSTNPFIDDDHLVTRCWRSRWPSTLLGAPGVWGGRGRGCRSSAATRGCAERRGRSRRTAPACSPADRSAGGRPHR